MDKIECETENMALKADNVLLRKQLADLQLKYDELLYQSTASLPVGELVEVDEGWLYTTATPVMETLVGGEARQDHEAVSLLHSEEERGELSPTPVPHTSTNSEINAITNSEINAIIVDSSLHRLSRRGPVRILSCRSAPMSADLFNNEVQTTNSFGINAVLIFLDVWDQWTIHAVQGTTDTFTFRSSHGFYLCAEPDGKVIANRTVAKEWEQFTACELGENKYAFRSCHGKYLW